MKQCWNINDVNTFIQLSRVGKTVIENTLTCTTRVDKKLILIDADFTSFLRVYNRIQVGSDS